MLSLPSVNNQIEREKNAAANYFETDDGQSHDISQIRFMPEDLEQKGITEMRLNDYIKDIKGGTRADPGRYKSDVYWRAVNPKDLPLFQSKNFYADLNGSESDFKDFLKCGTSPQVDRPIVALAKALEQNTSLTKLIIGPGQTEARSVTLNLCCCCVLECCCCCLRFPHLVSVLFSGMAPHRCLHAF